MVRDNTPSHEIDYGAISNPEEFKKCIVGSKLTAILPYRVVELHWEGSAIDGATLSSLSMMNGGNFVFFYEQNNILF